MALVPTPAPSDDHATAPLDRAATFDEQAGMTWSNAQSDSERGRWLAIAGGSAVAADAWASYKAHATKLP